MGATGELKFNMYVSLNNPLQGLHLQIYKQNWLAKYISTPENNQNLYSERSGA